MVPFIARFEHIRDGFSRTWTVLEKGDDDGCFRYPYGKCHALMCDGSARTFAKGTIQKGHVRIDRANR